VTLRKSLIGGACLSLQPLVLNALSVPAMAYIIRQLGPTGYGQWTMATALVGAMAVLSSLGLRGAFIRQVAAEPHTAADALAEQLGLRLMMALAVAVLAIALCFALRYPPAVICCAAVSAATMVLTSFSTTLMDLFQSLHRLTTMAAVNLLAGVVLTALSLVAAWMKLGPIAVALAYLTGPLVSAIVLVALVGKVCPIRVRFSFSAAWQLLMRCRSFTAQQLTNSAPAYVDALVLPRLIGSSQFGFFSAGTLLPTRLAIVPDGLCTAAYPHLSKRFHQTRTGGAKLTLYYLGILIGICLPLAVLVALLAGPIARVLFPHQSDICRAVIVITIWSLPLTAIESVLGNAINAAGADAEQARATLPAALCNVLLTVILVSRFGIAGACFAIPVRNLVRIAVLSICFLRALRIIADEEVIAPAAALAA
jgi:O-antigen/teichoic acid export membrane protein